MYAISYFWSQDKWQSQFDTVSKLSFILLPLLAGAGTRLKLRGTGLVLLAFIAGTFITSLYCLDQANTRWQEDGNINHFFYHELTRGLEATAVYMAWYVAGALAALLLFPWSAASRKWMIWWRWPLVAFFSFFLILLASRLMMLSFLLLIVPAFGMRHFIKGRRRALLILSIAIGVAIGSVLVLAQTQNPIRRRFSDIMRPDMSTVTKDNYHGIEPKWTNLTLRLFVWRIALENISANNLWWRGAGNGDVHTLQNKRIASHGITGMDENSKPRSSLFKVNMHNMYLQSLIMLGVGGLLLFLIISFSPLFYLRSADAAWFFGVFHIISIAFMMVEAALQTQAGVIYYCFFTSIFWTGVKRREIVQITGN
jgi:O-antigen ligase